MHESRNYAGVSTLSLLGVAFIVLKLTHHIDWSWWWVTVPFWGLPAIILAFGIVVSAGVIMGAIGTAFFASRRR